MARFDVSYLILRDDGETDETHQRVEADTLFEAMEIAKTGRPSHGQIIGLVVSNASHVGHNTEVHKE